MSHLDETRWRACQLTPVTVDDFWMELKSRRRSKVGDNPAIRQAWAVRESRNRNEEGDVLVLGAMGNGRGRLGKASYTDLDRARTCRGMKTRGRSPHLRLRLYAPWPLYDCYYLFCGAPHLTHPTAPDSSVRLCKHSVRGSATYHLLPFNSQEENGPLGLRGSKLAGTSSAPGRPRSVIRAEGRPRPALAGLPFSLLFRGVQALWANGGGYSSARVAFLQKQPMANWFSAVFHPKAEGTAGCWGGAWLSAPSSVCYDG